MNLILLFLFHLFLFNFSLPVQNEIMTRDSSFHVYLLIGQSNMAGRGELDSVPQNPSSNIVTLDSTNNWVPARDPLHFDKPKMTGVGPGMSFAKSMLEKDPGKKMGLIPSAWGGSPISVWKPGEKYLDHYPYDEAVARAKIGMQKGVLKGILWHQGESDNSPEMAAIYLENIKELVKNLRRDLNAPNLPFIAGEIGYFNKKNFINEIINQIDEEIPHSAVVSAKGLKDKGDQLHFDTPSARELGKRYAEALKILEEEKFCSQR